MNDAKVSIYHSAMTGRWYVGFGRNKDGIVRRKHDVTEQMEEIVRKGGVINFGPAPTGRREGSK